MGWQMQRTSDLKELPQLSSSVDWEGFIVTDYMPRIALAIGALAGWVHAGKLKNKVDVQHGLENAPATLRRLVRGLQQGQATTARRRVVRSSKWGWRQRPSEPKSLKPLRASSNLRWQSVLTNV